MNRRGFLKLLGLGAAAVAAEAVPDPECLLWVPGQKTIFLPPERKLCRCGHVIDPNQKPLTEDDIRARYIEPAVRSLAEEWDKQILEMFQKNLEVAKVINRHYDDRFLRLGDVITVRTPMRFAS